MVFSFAWWSLWRFWSLGTYSRGWSSSTCTGGLLTVSYRDCSTIWSLPDLGALVQASWTANLSLRSVWWTIPSWFFMRRRRVSSFFQVEVAGSYSIFLPKIFLSTFITWGWPITTGMWTAGRPGLFALLGMISAIEKLSVPWHSGHVCFHPSKLTGYPCNAYVDFGSDLITGLQ